MPATAFPDHTLESAPAAAQAGLSAIARKQGFLPAAAARMATSPEVLSGFLKMNALFEAGTLDQLSREVLSMTMATRNDCHVCVAMHTGVLTALEAEPALIAALRGSTPLPDERLEAMRQFILAVLAANGAVDDAAIEAFTAHGYTARNALEVTLGIATYTLSTFANRMTGAPVDEPLARFARPRPGPDGRAPE
ncbi:alkylhydroperoxidase AhpD family core domain-containing protein [Streptomyces sp. 2131.1]|uniref:carboxymuconolactone decarboxylase family protein n=1 Tax=Streptomyces sp. 2131.1 TaxID=1855346 RepID=UPI0008980208|nr:carboxymuconolactone decarboxylase family protein [Streptomyces sp. 2131.1]SED83527.1 alkylhydroperoxidase AhpD family core domain-containing protein [Streptomyces sp. 2131.1]